MAIFLSWLANRRLPLLDVMQNFASQGNIFKQSMCTNLELNIDMLLESGLVVCPSAIDIGSLTNPV